MRASDAIQKGNTGTSEVSAAFERIQWGVASNDRHDLGTDLFLAARDARRFDTLEVVGAQVKAGPDYFGEPQKDDAGKVTGWWYRDTDRSHVDDWAQHGLPHLIVLHDLESRKSYWQHVTADAIVSTGTGAKILVPKANTVDEAHRDELLAVAATQRPASGWEGSAWAGAGELAPRDQLRYALVVPRLVAPHPNAGRGEPITAYQAVALLAQVRFNDLGAFAEQHESVPTLSDAAASSDWLWRYVAALGRWITNEDLDGLLAAIEDAPAPEERVAATVSAACALVELARPEEAIDLLKTTIDRDDARPVDHAWLQAQHARACVEIGSIEDARNEAASVQTVRTSAPNDVTASALAGTAAVLLFNTAAIDEHDLAGTIAGGDTAASWWLTQTTSRALNAIADRAFKDWARSTEFYVGPDVANNQLVAAALVANHVADHGAFRHMLSLLGRDTLLRLDRHADAEEAAQGLTTLRLSGDEKSLELAVRKLCLDGPASAVTRAAAAVDLDKATRTTAPTSLSLLRHGADLLDATTAERTLQWLLGTLDDSTDFVTRTTAWYLVELRLLEILAAILPAVEPCKQQAVIERVIQLPKLDREEQLVTEAWARVVGALSDDAWSSDVASAAAQAVEAQPSLLRGAVMEAAARFDPEIRNRLQEEAREGSVDALAAFGDVSELSEEAATEIVGRLAGLVKREIADAHGGARSFGATDPGHDLALLNVNHPSAAQWAPLLEMLSDDAVWPRTKRGALEILLGKRERIPEEVVAELKPIVAGLASKACADWRDPLDRERDVRGPATCLALATGAVPADEATELLFDLVAGERNDRRWAAEVARLRHKPEDVGLLLGMAVDRDPFVRGAAAMALAWLLGESLGGDAVEPAVARCVGDPGTQVPASVAHTLAYLDPRSNEGDRVLHRLADHPSATVRRHAGR